MGITDVFVNSNNGFISNFSANKAAYKNFNPVYISSEDDFVKMYNILFKNTDFRLWVHLDKNTLDINNSIGLQVADSIQAQFPQLKLQLITRNAVKKDIKGFKLFDTIENGGKRWSDYDFSTIPVNSSTVKPENSNQQPENELDFDYDVAIITALSKPELEAVLNLEGFWKEHNIKNDSTTYNIGYFEKDNTRKKIVAVSAPQMGMVASSTLCVKLVKNFRPKYIIMPGIAAGVKGETNFGDIIVADLTYDASSGKIITDDDGNKDFSPNPTPIPLNQDIKEIVRNYETKDEYFFNLKKSWPGNKPDTELKIKVGPLASVPYVIQNSNELSNIKKHQRKLIGLEMESYGVFYSAYNGLQPKPIPISIKSVCDFGDKNKADNYQKYAAYTSANFMYDFILNEL